jgi:hypothetical protein
MTIFVDYPCFRVLLDGIRWSAIEVTAMIECRILVGRLAVVDSYDAFFSYPNIEKAIYWIVRWDGDVGTEPDGWISAWAWGQDFVRRRIEGRPETEYEDRCGLCSSVVSGGADHV